MMQTANNETKLNQPFEPTAEIYRLNYAGQLPDVAKVVGMQSLFCLLSLGLYSPWLLARLRSHFAEATTFLGIRFSYRGQGFDIFVNNLNRLGFLISWIGLTILAGGLDPLLQILVGIVGLCAGLFLIPFSLYSAFSYSMSRTQWGDRRMLLGHGAREFSVKFLVGTILSSLSFGMYLPIMLNDVLRLVLQRVAVGELRLMYNGRGKHLFKIHLFHTFLAVPCLGLNVFWYVARVARYVFNATFIGSREAGAVRGFLDIRGGDLFGLALMNLFCIVGSFGLAIPWVMHFNYNFMMRRVKFYGHLILPGLTVDYVQSSSVLSVAPPPVSEAPASLNQAIPAA
jgi:uncharacterized membrane protein YjgN (DUF898 family)